jgi:hypothetical protein
MSKNIKHYKKIRVADVTPQMREVCIGGVNDTLRTTLDGEYTFLKWRGEEPELLEDKGNYIPDIDIELQKPEWKSSKADF